VQRIYYRCYAKGIANANKSQGRLSKKHLSYKSEIIAGGISVPEKVSEFQWEQKKLSGGIPCLLKLLIDINHKPYE